MSLIQCAQSDLLNALKIASKVIERGTALEILGYVRLRDAGNCLEISATDLHSFLKFQVRVTSERNADKPMDVLVPFKAFSDAVKQCASRGGKRNPDPIVELSLSGVTLQVKASLSFFLHTRAGHDFPNFPTAPSYETIVSYDADKLLTALQYAIPAMSADETRFHICGLHFHAGNVVATDGHRLHKANSLPPIPGDEGYILPARSAHALAAMLKSDGAAQVSGGFNKTFAHFFSGVASLMIKLVQAAFPPYEQIIPANSSRRISVARKPLVAIMDMAHKTFRGEHGVRIEAMAGEPLALKCDSDVGGTTFAHEVPCAVSGSSLRIGVNPLYLSDALADLDGVDVDLLCNDELDPILVSDGSRLAVIMPMRV